MTVASRYRCSLPGCRFLSGVLLTAQLASCGGLVTKKATAADYLAFYHRVQKIGDSCNDTAKLALGLAGASPTAFYEMLHTGAQTCRQANFDLSQVVLPDVGDAKSKLDEVMQSCSSGVFGQVTLLDGLAEAVDSGELRPSQALAARNGGDAAKEGWLQCRVGLIQIGGGLGMNAAAFPKEAD